MLFEKIRKNSRFTTPGKDFHKCHINWQKFAPMPTAQCPLTQYMCVFEYFHRKRMFFRKFIKIQPE